MSNSLGPFRTFWRAWQSRVAQSKVISQENRNQLTKEFLISAKQKLTTRPSFTKLSFWKQQFAQQLGSFGIRYDDGSQPVKTCLEFTPETDLSDWTVLSDHLFGGTSTCTVRLGTAEIPVTHEDPKTGETTTTHKVVTTVIFEGYLRSLQRFEDHRGRVLSQFRAPVKLRAPIRPLISDHADLITSITTRIKEPDELKLPAWMKQARPRTPVLDENGNPVPQEQLIDGFAACISPSLDAMNLSQFDFLTIMVKTDGRPYVFNVRCRNRWGVIHQCRIRGETPRPMHPLEVKFENFASAIGGYGTPIRHQIRREAIESFGFSISGPDGPFRFELAYITATRGMPNYEKIELYEEQMKWQRANEKIAAERQRRLAAKQEAGLEHTLLDDLLGSREHETEYDVKQQKALEEDVKSRKSGL